MNVSTENLYDRVVRVTYDYLGPAADRFVARQVRSHLHKEPEQLKKTDLTGLIDWIKIAMNLLSNDDRLVARYISELRELTLNQRGR
jgi:hypothetical protein